MSFEELTNKKLSAFYDSSPFLSSISPDVRSDSTALSVTLPPFLVKDSSKTRDSTFIRFVRSALRFLVALSGSVVRSISLPTKLSVSRHRWTATVFRFVASTTAYLCQLVGWEKEGW